MKKHLRKRPFNGLPDPTFPESGIYPVTCPKCGAQLYCPAELQHDKKLPCPNCDKNIPNPLYDPADPGNRRRARARCVVKILIATVLIALSTVYTVKYIIPGLKGKSSIPAGTQTIKTDSLQDSSGKSDRKNMAWPYEIGR
ncbi:MAG TPA: hypothetical protein DDZ96_12255 [Porphyromonadaceae bacterium]|jgi:uncharacterized paraquat-inducible protein A|nr:hypothetical protein [Porphyromonadaceae bacterium]HBL34569.1 hypothetical protein [Porphyromonadaceae bacterium]HBX20687.1 hypothetical protein [Porphyromonadaceae bacterium]HCM21414.1 hypothetical protein [Porphyromonadaceae bacterium]